MTHIAWDGSTLSITFRVHPGVPAEHDVFWARGAPQITCDGAQVEAPVPDERSVYSLACGGTSGDHVLAFGAAR